MNQKKSGCFCFWLILATFFSCTESTSTVIFHTDMGEMTVDISPHLPGDIKAQLKLLVAAEKAPVAVEKVLNNGYVQLNFEVVAIQNVPRLNQAPTSNTFVVQHGRFFIVQGRAQTDATLDKWEQNSGRKISPDFREQYKKHGGALQLEGNSMVLGKVVAGQATLDRIAALPNDAMGRPLRPVGMRLEVLK